MPLLKRRPDVEPDLRELIARSRQRLGWRHIVVALVGIFVELIAMGYVATILIPERFPAQTFDTRWVVETGTVLLPLLASVYVIGACITSFGYSRFEVDRAVRRLPLVLVLSLLMTLLLCIGLLLPRGGSGGGGGWSGARHDPVREAEAARHRAANSLACRLLSPAAASAILGAATGMAKASWSRVIRMSSCTYAAEGRSITLTVRPLSIRMRRRIRAYERKHRTRLIGEITETNGSLALHDDAWQIAVRVDGRDLSPGARDAAEDALRSAMAQLRSADG